MSVDWKLAYRNQMIVNLDLQNEIVRLQEQAHYHYENGLKKDVKIDRLRDIICNALECLDADDVIGATQTLETMLKEGE